MGKAKPLLLLLVLVVCGRGGVAQINKIGTVEVVHRQRKAREIRD